MKLVYIHDNCLDSEKANIIQVLQMCKAFVLKNCEVVLYIPRNRRKDENEKDTAMRLLGGVPNFEIKNYSEWYGASRFIFWLNGIKAGLMVKNIEKADIYMTRSSLIYHYLVKNKQPVIYEAHNSLLHKNKLVNYFLTRILVKDLNSTYLTLFIAISTALLRHWLSYGIDADRSIALHDGFSPDEFSHKYNYEQIKTNIGVRKDRMLAMYTGSLYADRGIERIIKLAAKFSHIDFVVIGGPDERVKELNYYKQDSKLSNIFFLGFVPHCEISSYLLSADILIMIWSKQVKTINYCSPLKLFEYMAAGKTIVGDGYPTIKEVLNSDYALLAEPDSYDSLEDKFRQACDNSNDVALLGNAVKELAYTHYTWEQRVSKILNKIA